MQRRMKERGRITLKKYPRNSKRIIDQEGTTQILDATHVMWKATSQEIVPETKDPPRKTKRKGIILTLLKMMNWPRREKGRIPQVLRNMYFDTEEFNPWFSWVSWRQKGTMLRLLKMMNQPRREKGRISQVMRNMYFDPEWFNPWWRRTFYPYNN